MDTNAVRPLSLLRPDGERSPSPIKIAHLRKVGDEPVINVLLVINDKEELDILSGYLSDGYRLFTARNEKALIKKMELESIQLIIICIGINEGKAGDLCARVKSTRQYAHIPVIQLGDQNSVIA